MELKLITGATTFEACVNTIKQIDPSNLDITNLVVVPDSFSMQAESLIFDILNIKSTINIEVVGISRLASKILRNNNIKYNRISGLEEVFCLFKVVKENEGKFQYFHKCGVDFCKKILQIIKQFKACKIKPEQIKSVGDELLDKKMADLKLIYEQYNNQLADKLDLSGLLDFFIENASQTLDLTKIKLFFVNFDSFSLEINSFICKLSKLVNSVFIGMARPISPNNAFIYEDDILKKTSQLAKENGIFLQVENSATNLKDQHLIMAKNLFGFNIELSKNDWFLNVVAKNKQDEVEFVAKYIKRKVFEGNRFKDFAIAVANEKYLDVVKTCFSKYNIATYCDDANDLSQTILGRFVFKMIEIAKLGFDMPSLKYLVNFPFKDIVQREEILTQIFYYNIESENEFLDRFSEYKKIIEHIKNLKNCKKISEYSKILVELIDFVDFDLVLQTISEEKLYQEESENSQSKELIKQVFEKLSLISEYQEIELGDFENLLKFAFSSVKVETIPSYVDAVYVGDATTSYFEDVNTLFVLGATANSLPRTQSDIGIIDDDDIKKLKLQFALEPEIKVLNRRSRLKIFEMLQHAKQKLIICNPISEDGKVAQKAGFLNDLLKMFGENVLHTLALEDFNLGLYDESQTLDNILFYLGAQSNALLAYSKIFSEHKLPQKFEGCFKDYFHDCLKQSDIFKVEDSGVIKKSVYSASQLESYFGCPFKHFMGYTLGIKQKENIEPNKRLFGVFQHAILKKFVEDFEQNCLDTDKFLSENVEAFAKEVYDEKILKRKQFLNFLKKESEILIKNIIKEQKYSNFKPFLLEEKLFCSIDNNKSLIGYIDRVDKTNTHFRIIDYKTGKTDSIRKDLYYGKKLQLFLYASAMKKRLGLGCAGVYYFDCKTNFQKNEKTEILLKGLTQKDDEIVCQTDTRLWQEDFKSDLIGMSRKKDSKDGFSFKFGNPADDLDQLIEYSQKVSSLAIEEIESGFIMPKPLGNECEHCPYISICRHNELQGFRPTRAIKTLRKEEK